MHCIKLTVAPREFGTLLEFTGQWLKRWRMKKLIASLQSTFVFLLSTYMLLFICKQGVRASTAHLSPELYFCLVFILTGFDFLYTCTMKRKLTLHRAPNSITKNWEDTICSISSIWELLNWPVFTLTRLSSLNRRSSRVYIPNVSS